PRAGDSCVRRWHLIQHAPRTGLVGVWADGRAQRIERLIDGEIAARLRQLALRLAEREANQARHLDQAALPADQILDLCQAPLKRVEQFGGDQVAWAHRLKL